MAKQDRLRFLQFCAAGVLGLLVDVAVLYACVGWLGWYGARALSFLAAVVATWGVNRSLAFGDRAAGHAVGMAREFGRYLLSMLGGGAANYAAYVLVLALYGGRGAGVLGVAAGSVCGLAFNYLSARRLVFRGAGARKS